MKFASRNNGTPDGELLLVSRDLKKAVVVSQVGSLRELVEQWDRHIDALQLVYDQLNAGEVTGSFAFDPVAMLAPLPRTWQWIDGSAYPNHAYWMLKSTGREPRQGEVPPRMYQGGSDTLLGAYADVPFPSEDHDIDLEAEVAVVLGDVPMGCSAEQAVKHVRLVMMANDWSLRRVQGYEITTGFGFFQSKPSTSFSPVAVTLDELGDHWLGDRMDLPVHVYINDVWVGSPNAIGMEPGFGGLIAHAALTRRLSAGTILGSGTVSENDPKAGSATIAEIRAIEQVNTGTISTPFLKYGDKVRIEVKDDQGNSIFGTLDQKVVPAPRPE